MRRALALLYGLAVYVAFLAVFVYAIAFVWNVAVPKTIDAGASPLPGPPLLVDLILLGLFAVQHSGMARLGFKKRWTKIVPVAVERSTYVLAASFMLALVMWAWSPLTGEVWSVHDAALADFLWALSAMGWAMVLLATFLIDHFHLFGLSQVWSYAQGRAAENPHFKTPLFYRRVRHPLYLGFIIAFWAAPHMSVGRLLFAVLTTAYMVVAIQLEERDLVRFHGADYQAYRQRVPMLIPLPRRDTDKSRPVPGTSGLAG